MRPLCCNLHPSTYILALHYTMYLLTANAQMQSACDLHADVCCAGVCPEPRMGHVAVVLGNSIVVHGGRTSPDQALEDVWAAQLPDGPLSAVTWAKIEPAALQPNARHRHSAVLLESEDEASTKRAHDLDTFVGFLCTSRLSS